MSSSEVRLISSCSGLLPDFLTEHFRTGVPRLHACCFCLFLSTPAWKCLMWPVFVGGRVFHGALPSAQAEDNAVNIYYIFTPKERVILIVHMVLCWNYAPWLQCTPVVCKGMKYYGIFHIWCFPSFQDIIFFHSPVRTNSVICPRTTKVFCPRHVFLNMEKAKWKTLQTWRGTQDSRLYLQTKFSDKFLVVPSVFD